MHLAIWLCVCVYNAIPPPNLHDGCNPNNFELARDASIYTGPSIWHYHASPRFANYCSIYFSITCHFPNCLRIIIIIRFFFYLSREYTLKYHKSQRYNEVKRNDTEVGPSPSLAKCCNIFFAVKLPQVRV